MEISKSPVHGGHTISDTKNEFEKVVEQFDLQVNNREG